MSNNLPEPPESDDPARDGRTESTGAREVRRSYPRLLRRIPGPPCRIGGHGWDRRAVRGTDHRVDRSHRVRGHRRRRPGRVRQRLVRRHRCCLCALRCDRIVADHRCCRFCRVAVRRPRRLRDRAHSRDLSDAFLEATWESQHNERAGQLQELLTTFIRGGAQLIAATSRGIVALCNLLALTIAVVFINACRRRGVARRRARARARSSAPEEAGATRGASSQRTPGCGSQPR